MKIAVKPTTLEKLICQIPALPPALLQFPLGCKPLVLFRPLGLELSSLSTPVNITMSMGKLSGRR